MYILKLLYKYNWFSKYCISDSYL